jgi:UDP-N-acetylmuramoyl-L-alanyl-D-glutamate--2,6-diaminopimelate ligase
LYSCLSTIQDNSCQSVVMEVSSEALLHERTQGLKFSIVAITNITEDHLNIHKTIENYRKCKFKIVDYLTDDGVAIINGDDENCQILHVNNLIKFGFNDDNDYVISDFVEDKNGVKFKIRHNDSIYDISSQLFGRYNAYNITLAFIIGLLNNIDAETLISRIKDISFITGRGERLNFGQKFEIILDYAHTYNAILNLLNSVKGKYKRVITVTGAAGGREKEKRSKIGKMVLEKSDLVIFTMDDPRWESVDDIIDDMIGECKNTNYERINDRVEAISHAFDIANEGDAVLVIGKGRDDYMALGTEKIPYCDYDVIRNYFDK